MKEKNCPVGFQLLNSIVTVWLKDKPLFSSKKEQIQVIRASPSELYRKPENVTLSNDYNTMLLFDFRLSGIQTYQFYKQFSNPLIPPKPMSELRQS